MRRRSTVDHQTLDRTGEELQHTPNRGAMASAPWCGRSALRRSGKAEGV